VEGYKDERHDMMRWTMHDEREVQDRNKIGLTDKRRDEADQQWRHLTIPPQRHLANPTCISTSSCSPRRLMLTPCPGPPFPGPCPCLPVYTGVFGVGVSLSLYGEVGSAKGEAASLRGVAGEPLYWYCGWYGGCWYCTCGI